MKTFINRRSFVILLIFCILIRIHSQPFLFTRYPIESGLSQSVINCMFQDSKGYIWIGTQNGLNRFDGYTFEVFLNKPSDTTTLSNNWIYSIDEDRNGDLWIGTKGGLNQFISSEKRFHRVTWNSVYTNNITDHIYDARVLRNGWIVINTPPVLTLYDPGDGSFRHYITIIPYDGAVKDNRIPVMEDKEGMIWIGSTMGLACFNPADGQFSYFFNSPGMPRTLSSNNITAIYEKEDYTIWIGTSNGMNIYDKKSRKINQVFHDPKDPLSLNNNFIRSIAGDPLGRIWIGTEGGGLNLATVSPEGRIEMQWFTSEPGGISHNIVLSLIVDRSLNLWIGTLQGLSKTDLKPQKFNLYRTSGTKTPVNLLGNVIASIFKDDDGLIWVGNWGQGLNILDRKTGKVEHFSSGQQGNRYIQNDFVHVIFEDADQNIWIGTRDGILVYDRTSDSFVRLKKFFHNVGISEFKNMRIYKIIRSRDGDYWIGTQNGLYRINPGEKETEIYLAGSSESHRISANQVYCLLEDKEGLIWIATLGGLDVYDPKNQSFMHYVKDPKNANSLCDNFVTALCEDHKGNIWIGTNSYVNKFSKKDSLFTYYSKENGFPSNLVYQIIEDDRKNIWFATGGGLCRFDTVTGRFRIYTVDEGLQSMEFNIGAGFKSSDGEIFFGGMNGFNSFYPDSLRDNTFIPAVVITSCYKTIGADKVYIEIHKTQNLILGYDDNTFTIEFSALEFTNPEKNKYAYMLVGVSKDWIETGNRRFVPFSNLPPGEYTFRVKGSNNDGIWNDSGTSLRIIIKPPWWRSIWAWLTYILALTIAILLYIRIRERNLRREKEILEQKVHIRTLQIEAQNTQILQKNEELNELNRILTALNSTKDKFFSIIAHDLRNPFHTILGLSEIVLGKIGKEEPEKIRKSVADIHDSAKHTFDLLQNLLLWARSQTGSLDFEPMTFDLSDRIRENVSLVKSQAAKKNIEINYPGTVPVMAKGDIRMVDTVLRNLLTNAIKFTQQNGQISISTTEKDNHIEVMVRDTGIGIEKENLSRIFDLDNKYTRRGTEKERGTGLGLVLCREFIEKHQGTISVISEQGEGSRFIFTLPK